eukprot:maker-scaffold_76-snap-gene-0.88-mRNA-1 protein AED:0.42 eAED:0.58 QI:0/0/0/0.66/0/0/3/0/79
MCLAIGNTPRENNKVKLTWSGPDSVIELLSSNVCKVRLLNGETQIVHEPDDFVPDDSLRKLFKKNWESWRFRNSSKLDV